MKDKVYIIHSEYVQHGMTFNSKTRYVHDKDKAIQIYEETLQQMKEDNQDMLSNKDSYSINKGGQRANKFFTCYYKYQPQVSNFLVEISAEELE
jgi:hypothetical protein